MNEIFSELVDKKKTNVEDLIRQIDESSKSIIDNKLILETVLIHSINLIFLD